MKRILSICLFAFASVASATADPPTREPQRELTTAGKEYYHAMLLYDSYVGRRPEQIANFRALTIARIEGAARLLKEEAAPDLSLAKEIASSLDMLYAIDHMAQADAHFAQKETQAGHRELAVACGHAAKVPELIDEHFKQLCKRQDQSST